ncbi:MAG: MOSC N-terminal beta barrel domain-containing protein [Thermodesulfobacteriota bacterium]
MILSALHVYPVKSCRGIAPARWQLDAFGLAGDRSWMVVDERGTFLTQREEPRLALVEARFADDDGRGAGVVLAAPGRPELHLPPARAQAGDREVEVWRHRGPAVDAGDAAAGWMSAHLGRAARLVALPRAHARQVDHAWFAGDAHAAFSDAYPLLLIGEASLEDLNARLRRPLPMSRFRPNLVVRGAAPYAEDRWKRIRIGEIELDIVKPCARCVITTTEQTTGERDGTEPLATLATYRKTELGVLFGQNAVHLERGTLEVGAHVEVLETRAAVRVRPEQE